MRQRQRTVTVSANEVASLPLLHSLDQSLGCAEQCSDCSSDRRVNRREALCGALLVALTCTWCEQHAGVLVVGRRVLAQRFG
jgi:hypothetical protein